MDYKAAGVDVEAGYKAVELIKKHVSRTVRAEVMSGLGGFGGAFSIAAAKKMADPILVSGTDSVGSKIKLAFISGRHDTVGIDCVAMCVNDIVCCGAEPLFFLDYIGCNKNVPEIMEQIVKGVADGCVMAGCAIIGGEMAELPDLYAEGEYDLVGFATGIVDRSVYIDGSATEEGDAVIGIASSGLHSNGYALVRKLLQPDAAKLYLLSKELNATYGDELLRPTKIYVKPVLKLIKNVKVKGIGNMTGGGLFENIPRTYPAGLCARIEKGSWPVPRIYDYLQKAGGLTDDVMYGTFNMGIGMTVTVPVKDVVKCISLLERDGEKGHIIGRIVKNTGNKIEIC